MGESTIIAMLVGQREREVRAQELNVQRRRTLLHGLVRPLDQIGLVVFLLLLFVAGVIGAIGGLCTRPFKKI